jgi:integrase
MKIRFKYVKAYNSKGRTYYYFRRGSVSIRLDGPPGSSQFNESYAMALDANGGPSKVGAGRNLHGSVSALIGLYGETHHFKDSISPQTRAQRWQILQRFRNEFGTLPVARIERKHMMLMLAKLTPAVQKNWVKALRPMFAYAVEIEWLKQNPLRDVKVKHKGGEFTPWTEAEVAIYRAHHPLGTMARLAIELLIGTMMRSSDVVTLGPGNVLTGKLVRRTKKTGALLALPILPELRAALDAMPASDEGSRAEPAPTFLTNSLGKPFAMPNWHYTFGRWVSEAGLPDQFRAHGLRKLGCTRLANAGASPHVIAAWSGHKSIALVAHYTKSADQVRLAEQGADILREAQG